MKKTKFLLLGLLLPVGVNTKAQLAEDATEYTRISFSYASWIMKYEIPPLSLSETLPGFKLGLTEGVPISKDFPSFLEIGLDFSYNTKSEAKDGISVRSSTAAFTVPVSLNCKLVFGNGLFLSPYLGLHAKVNIIGKDTYSEGHIKITEKWKSLGYGYNRGQVGWQGGLNLGIKKFIISAGYTSDFIPLFNKGVKAKTSGFIVGFAYQVNPQRTPQKSNDDGAPFAMNDNKKVYASVRSRPAYAPKDSVVWTKNKKKFRHTLLNRSL